MNKKIKKERELVINMMNYLRDAEASTNNPADIYRFWKDCKEKAKNGLIWHKSDSNAELVFLRYFRIESTLRRLQMLYEYKCKKEPRYKHLSIFGFYLQLKPRERVLYQVDWPVVSCDRAVSAIIDEDEEGINSDSVKKQIKNNFKDDNQKKISMEEHLHTFDVYLKVETRTRAEAMKEVKLELYRR